MAQNVTYSFLDCSAALSGPGGSLTLTGGGTAREGITFSRNNDTNSMMVGADGVGMHSLRADKSGTVTVRLLRTNPLNSSLSKMFDYQTTSSANHGQNVISGRNPVRGDDYEASGCAFKRKPPLNMGEDGDVVEWQFDAIRIDGEFGDGTPAA